MEQVNNFIQKISDFDYLKFLSNTFSLLTFESFLKLIVIYFFIVWISIIIWVIRDIINRTNNIFFQIFSILTVVIGTPLGIVIYLLIRPSKTLFEKYYEEASILEEDLSDFGEKEEEIKCPKCNYEIKAEYKFCPNCRVCLKKECLFCKKELKPEWTFCPFCGKDQDNKVDKILNNISKDIEKGNE
ncbi:MAG: zinc ribbon domain-containing protein [Candidatus Gracilibacteria bacterium]|nr:zinc ribbon domain-containing protein [Candidatus Gracilibacteria bacterium]